MSRAIDLVRIADLIASAAQQARFLVTASEIDSFPEVSAAIKQIETAASDLQQAGRKLQNDNIYYSYCS